MIRLLLAATLLIALGGLVSRFSNGRLLGAAGAPNASGTTAAPVAAAGQVSYELTDGALTDQVNATLGGQPFGDTPLGPATIRRLAIHFRDGHVDADGDAQAGSATLPVSLTGSVTLQDGRPVVAVQRATMAGVVLPESARSRVERTMQTNVEDALASRRVHLVSLTTLDGKLVAVGTPAS